MLLERIDQLQQEYLGRRVIANGHRPELVRFRGRVGVVKAISCNGRALVQFPGEDRAWYDIELEDLKVVESEEANPPARSGAKLENSEGAGGAEAQAPKKAVARSALELAREKANKKTNGISTV